MTRMLMDVCSLRKRWISGTVSTKPIDGRHANHHVCLAGAARNAPTSDYGTRPALRGCLRVFVEQAARFCQDDATPLRMHELDPSSSSSARTCGSALAARHQHGSRPREAAELRDHRKGFQLFDIHRASRTRLKS
jgi:hypothetical protein